MSTGDVLAIAGATLALRLLVAVAFIVITGQHLSALAQLRDGPSYVRMAGRMLDASSLLTHFDRRVFLGYPLLVALLGATGLPLSLAALAVSWLASVMAAVCSALAFRDRRVGWGMALFPSFLGYSSLAMSEAAFLAFVAVGLYFVLRRGWLVGGALALGYAGLVRPVACFAVLGILALLLVRRRFGSAVLVAILSAIVVATGLLALRLWHGDALEGIRIYAQDRDEYAGQVIAWPFQSLLSTPWRSPVPLWRIAYVWAYVAVVLGGCALAIRRVYELLPLRDLLQVRSPTRDATLVAAAWLLASTTFVLSTGGVWGFFHFDRHLLAALPALLWFYRTYFPRCVVTRAALGACCAGLALLVVLA